MDVTVLDAEKGEGGSANKNTMNGSNFASKGWHTEFVAVFSLVLHKCELTRSTCRCSISWEPMPSDFTMLKMTLLPKVGGDTLVSYFPAASDTGRKN
jgi:alpha-ketoglutarate-dependent taurine dioxygenase